MPRSHGAWLCRPFFSTKANHLDSNWFRKKKEKKTRIKLRVVSSEYVVYLPYMVYIDFFRVVVGLFGMRGADALGGPIGFWITLNRFVRFKLVNDLIGIGSWLLDWLTNKILFPFYFIILFSFHFTRIKQKNCTERFHRAVDPAGLKQLCSSSCKNDHS